MAEMLKARGEVIEGAFYINGDHVRVGDRVVRGPKWPYAGQDHVEGRPGVGTVLGAGVPSAWVVVRWDSGDDNSYKPADGHIVLEKEAKQTRPKPTPFQVKGHTPKLVLKLGCKEFELAGFKKRALRAKRLLPKDVVPDVEIRVMGESGVTAADIDGLLAWLDKEIEKA